MHPELTGFPVQVEVPVGFGDMDAYGHVNNTRYLRWFEDARFAGFHRAGFEEHRERTGIGPILARVTCIFRRPVTYPDTVISGVRVTELGDDRFSMVHRVVSRSQGDVVAEGDARIVMVDYRLGGKAPLPPELRARLERELG